MAAIVSIYVYKINSNYVIPNPYGTPMAFGVAGLQVQPNTGSTINQLRDGTTAFLYSAVRHTSTGTDIFYSSATVAQIVSAANA